MSSFAVLPYPKLPASFEEWDARALDAAAYLTSFLMAHIPYIRAEHIGSTAVQGCGGKGVIDLMVLYPLGGLDTVRENLDQLGFQKQTGRDPFPEERPMRTGAIQWNDKQFRIHVHVIAEDSEEPTHLRCFRDRLRGDSEFRSAYMERKRAILASGITDSLDYCLAKGEFIERATK